MRSHTSTRRRLDALLLREPRAARARAAAAASTAAAPSAGAPGAAAAAPEPAPPPPPSPRYHDWSTVPAQPVQQGDSAPARPRPAQALTRDTTSWARPARARSASRRPGRVPATSWTPVFRGPSATTTSSTRRGSSSRSRRASRSATGPSTASSSTALNSRFSGRENLTHLVMYKKMPGLHPSPDDRGGGRPALQSRRARGEHG